MDLDIQGQHFMAGIRSGEMSLRDRHESSGEIFMQEVKGDISLALSAVPAGVDRIILEHITCLSTAVGGLK